uniref:Uncharacterized protein n=1 Tax=Anguilla anguilla TaxID=7936 RepID=A0A0E9QD44_ANGAN
MIDLCIVPSLKPSGQNRAAFLKLAFWSC